MEKIQQCVQLEEAIVQALKEAQLQGATAAEVDAHGSTGYSVTIRKGEIETVEFNRDQGLGVTVYYGQRKGSASTSDASAAAIKEAVHGACSIAKYASEDPCCGLADANLMAKKILNLDLDYPWDLAVEEAITLAQACEQAAFAVDKRIVNSEGASIATHRGYRAYGNSHGFIGSYAATRHNASCVVIAQDQDEMQRDYWYTVARDATALEAVVHIGRTAAERTLQRLQPRSLGTMKVPVLFTAEVAGSLWGHFLAAISGGNLYRKSSFLLEHLGQRIFPDAIQIYEQPHLLKALGSAPFDAEGVATRDKDFVTAGILKNYVLGSYSARKLGMQTTANAGGVHNLCISSSEQSFQDLLVTMNRGLIITELMGQGVNIVTGDYSRGVSGFWVEQGEIQYPVQGITIAGNLKAMFLNIVAVGNDVDLRGNVRTGSVLVDKMSIAGH